MVNNGMANPPDNLNKPSPFQPRGEPPLDRTIYKRPDPASGGEIDPEKFLQSLEMEERISARRENVDRRQRLAKNKWLNMLLPFSGRMLAAMDSWLDLWRERVRRERAKDAETLGQLEKLQSLTPKERQRLAILGDSADKKQMAAGGQAAGGQAAGGQAAGGQAAGGQAAGGQAAGGQAAGGQAGKIIANTITSDNSLEKLNSNPPADSTLPGTGSTDGAVNKIN
jgi:hypothetical protein